MSYLDLDFKISKQNSNPRNRALSRSFNMRLFIFSAISAFMALSLVILLPSTSDNKISTTQILNLATQPNSAIAEVAAIPSESFQLAIKEKTESSPLNRPLETSLSSKSITIKHGDTLSSAFDKQGIKPSVLYKVMNDSKEGGMLKSIRKGERFEFIFSNNKLIQLLYHPDMIQTYSFSKNSKGQFISALSRNPLEAIPVYREGIIDSSLFLAAAKNDIPVNVIMNMVAIFGWDIDFALDIRKGDSFKLIYSELYQDGVTIKNGQILSAEFTNRNTTYQAILYTDPKGNSNYYSPDGKSMRKAFLRNPVKFSRISSRFTTKRWHPVLSKWKSHKGVDYAASRGTPIFATGDGRVVYKGRKGGYGRTIVIKHGGKYTTLYAHLNSYNRKVRSGSRVKQGQTIAYVGSSGLATGPHLHYEFRVSGAHRNPLTVKLPAAQPINKKYNASFQQTKDRLLNMLRIMGQG